MFLSSPRLEKSKRRKHASFLEVKIIIVHLNTKDRREGKE
jgi:hypothetical protein